ncbi:cation:proton antiporter [Gordonia sp. X0973]|uniref:monovalent cation/H+ antiporter complex subunit F n=1 Tax=Gordonia sp. X0973 TaxID=2742602 RepID=UPI000F52E479|nr:monovalent cation/H+ antiporter complex subunit F [Gordonia sp. X0973]QKT09002.1 cation:proton antiporter [Gordonia sp. X0973]
MDILWSVAAGMLLIAAVNTSIRLLAGPTTLDRLIALDMVIALTMSGLALWAGTSGDSSVISTVVAIALVNFIGSIAVARFRVRDDQ